MQGDTLRNAIEVAAKVAFTRRRNPEDCALLYLALGKKTQLQALCRAVRNDKLQEFFGHDFSEPRWRTAAMKNAYALLGKQQFSLAAAFFLLGGDLDSTVTICARQLADIQLALVLCRLHSNGAPALFEATVRRELLPLAQTLRDRWLTCIARLLLGEAEAAIAVLSAESAPAPAEMEDACVPASLGVSPSIAFEPCAATFCSVVGNNPRFRLASQSVPLTLLFQCAAAYQQAGMPLASLETLRAIDSNEAMHCSSPLRGLQLSASIDLLMCRSQELVDEATSPDFPMTPRRCANALTKAASRLEEEIQVRYPVGMHGHARAC